MPASLAPTDSTPRGLGSRFRRPAEVRLSPLTLTGPYDTGQLQAITLEPVTVTVTRSPLPGQEGDLVTALDDLVEAMAVADGSLGVGLFTPSDQHGDNTWQVVARFEDVRALRRWEYSAARIEALDALGPVVAESAVATAPTPGAFFDAVATTSAAHPVRRALHDAAWSLPIGFGLAVGVSPLLHGDPLAVRVIVTALVASLTYLAAIGPLRSALRRQRQRRAPLR